MLSLLFTSAAGWPLQRAGQQPLELGTSIVVHTLDSAIIVGADSRLHTPTGSRVQNTCKIRLFGNTVSANAGLAADQFSGFTLSDVAAESLRNHASLDAAIQSFEIRVSNFLEAFLPQIKRLSPTVYDSFEQKPGISAMFGRVNDGKPIVHVRSFS